MEIFLVILFSYFSGSIPFGVILTKFFGKIDLRKIGSGNIGATNVLRTGNKYLSVALFAFLMFVFRFVFATVKFET